MNKKEMNNKGFSLVELIIVIAIMAILVGVLAPQFIKYIESSRQSTDISTASEYRAAVEAYVAENGLETGTIEVTVTPTGMYATVDLSDVGLASGSSDETKTKSTGWVAAGSTANVASYSCTTYKWTPLAAGLANSKNPGKDMTDAFK